jgi:hypothetical protein
VTRFLAADKGYEAKNVNAFDEVPDSSWFTNRIGVHAMSVDDILYGPCGGKVIADAPHEPGSWLIDKGSPTAPTRASASPSRVSGSSS